MANVFVVADADSGDDLRHNEKHMQCKSFCVAAAVFPSEGQASVSPYHAGTRKSGIIVAQ